MLSLQADEIEGEVPLEKHESFGGTASDWAWIDGTLMAGDLDVSNTAIAVAFYTGIQAHELRARLLFALSHGQCGIGLRFGLWECNPITSVISTLRK